MALNKREEKTFVSVLSDGKIHLEVKEGTEGAILREYETSDKVQGSKWELIYDDIVGLISKIEFYKGDYGTILQVTLDDGETDPIILSLPTSSPFGEDLMKKLPNIDMTKFVRVAPYAFEDKGRTKKGITVYQRADDDTEVKVDSYFYDKEAKIIVNGYPQPPVAKKGKEISTDEWKVYFGTARIFMIDFITEFFKLDAPTTAPATQDSGFNDFDGDIVEEKKEEAPAPVEGKGMDPATIGK